MTSAATTGLPPASGRRTEGSDGLHGYTELKSVCIAH